MASCAVPDVQYNPNTVSKRPQERTRELYKYFQPLAFEKETSGGQPSSRDTVLTAYAQLVAWRLNARRCVISYFDEDTQYNVAEGTKTLFLDNGALSQDPADSLWKGATQFPVKGSICLQTLGSKPSFPDGASEFEATDLSKDRRFSNMPIVTGPPYMRYYYGTTFGTKKGINIGTVCVLDDKPRRPMVEEERHFLRSIASNVMVHLELLRERSERKRATKMNECLNLFIDPEASHPGRRKRRSELYVPSEPRKNRTGSNPYPLRPSSAQQNARKGRESQALESEPLAVETSETQTDEKNANRRVGEDDHILVFRKAADLLRMSLDIEGGGGVVFMDTANARLATTPMTPRETRGTNAKFDIGTRRASTFSQTVAEVLAASTAVNIAPSSYGEDEAEPADTMDENFTPLDLETLSSLVERFPQGKLWVFDSNGVVISDSESDMPENESKPQAEAAILLQHFPCARQVISIPLWEPRSHRWCVCFAYSTSKFRTLNTETDLLYCVAFCNCVTIEMGRLATLASDQLKGDFISSISHELRSPLHGILASCEFLQDTEGSSFQQSLVHTVSSCARTLLDTISMILDYTKINAFERDWRTVAKMEKNAVQATSGTLSTEAVLNASGQPTLNIYGNVDLAAVTEEVVEGVTAGHQHQDILTVDFGDAGSQLRGRPWNHESLIPHTMSDGKSKTVSSAAPRKGRVEVILDIEPRSWTFITQPGAFRRIVMNLVGNALKYTSSGWIRIHLDVQRNPATPSKPIEGSDTETATEIVVLTVADTGKGISPEFLRTKLFQAFAQEDHLASGTGLGLSLIRSILKMLNGDIDIVSTVDVGTKITVRIPMIPQSGSTLSSSNTPSTSSSGHSERAQEDSVLALRKLGQDKTFTIFKQTSEATLPLINGLNIVAGVHSKIRKYLGDWCRVSLIEWSPEAQVDVIVTDEADLPALLGSNCRSPNAAILVYCSYVERPALLKAYGDIGRIDFMSKPFGPYKLARALCISLQRNFVQQTATLETVPESGLTAATDSKFEPVKVEGKLSSGDIEVNVIQSGEVLAKEDSTNAQMAVDNLDQSSAGSSGMENPEHKEFPFLPVIEEGIASPALPHRPSLRDRRTMSPTASELHKISLDVGSTLNPMTAAGLAATTPVAVTTLEPDLSTSLSQPPAVPATPRNPHVLLVDDNTINLHLLQTYMKKRKYSGVSSATNGLEAVQRFEELSVANEPPDIIFMDISMPVMNGFEATRRIRAIEEAHNAGTDVEEGVGERRPSSLVIALTGLASSKDQSEAFLAGVDLYMTKPVSFKEVGRLLDNWIRNGGAREVSGVPFGAVTGGVSAESS